MLVVRETWDNKESKKYVVFKVRKDKKYYLISKNNQWKWVSAKRYVPVNEYDEKQKHKGD